MHGYQAGICCLCLAESSSCAMDVANTSRQTQRPGAHCPNWQDLPRFWLHTQWAFKMQPMTATLTGHPAALQRHGNGGAAHLFRQDGVRGVCCFFAAFHTVRCCLHARRPTHRPTHTLLSAFRTVRVCMASHWLWTVN